MNRARIWFEAHTDGSRRQRREARAEWSRPCQAARLLGQARDALRMAAAQERGARAATLCVEREALAACRWRLVLRARDLLYYMRRARAAGVLRCRVPS